MAELHSIDDVEKWIASLPDDAARRVAPALAARAALRAVPVVLTVRSSNADTALTLPVFRATAIARAVVLGPTRATAHSALSAYSALSALSADSALSALPALSALSALSASSAAASSAAASSAVSASRSADFVVSAALSTDSSLSAAFLADARLLETGDVATLLKQPLWREASPPAWAAAYWRELRQRLLTDDPDWWVWTDWYEQVLRGGEIHRPFEIARALIPDATWHQGPRAVNAEIARLAEAHGWPSQQGDRPEPAITAQPDIPPLKPAMIEPEIVNNRIVLPKRAADSALDSEAMQAALQSLRTAIENFLDDAKQTPGQDDRRLIQWLETIPAQIPSASPTQQQIFALGHAQERLTLTVQKLNKESPDHLAVSGMALNLHFERTMLQFPKWKEFKRNAATQALARDDFIAVQSFVRDVAIEIRDEDAAEVIASEIPEIIAEQADSLSAAIEAISISFQETVSDAPVRLAEDAVEGINNVFKRAAEWILLRLTPIRSIASGYTKAFGKSAVSEAKAIGKEDGKKFIRWLRNVAVRMAKWGIGLGATGFLASRFEWLPNLIEILSKMVL